MCFISVGVFSLQNKMADDENKNIQFVLEVEKYPCLYNTTLSSYSRKSKTDKAWTEIGETMNMTGAACKEKWRNLRVVFMRHLKPLPNGSGKKKKPYYLFEFMQFLTPHVKSMIPPEPGSLPPNSETEITETINTTTNVSNNVPTVPCTESCEAEPTPSCAHIYIGQPSPKKSKFSLHATDRHYSDYLKQKSSRLSESQTMDDAVMSFLNSLAPELREMDLQQFKMFKRRVLSLVDDILDPPPTSDSAVTIQPVTLSIETSQETV